MTSIRNGSLGIGGSFRDHRAPVFRETESLGAEDIWRVNFGLVYTASTGLCNGTLVSCEEGLVECRAISRVN